MAYTSGTAGVTSSATAIVSSDDAVGRRQSITVYNNGAATVYLGGSAVTTSIGLPLPVQASMSLDRAPGAALYGIAASGTVEVRYLTEDR